MRTRTRLSVDERRERLLRAGLELFGTHPYGSLSIDEITREAGISRGLLYHYFPSKREFHVAVVRLAVDELLALIEPDPHLAPLDRTQLSLRRYFEHVLRRRAGYLAITQGGLGADPEVVAQTDRVRQRVVDLIVAGTGEDTAELRVALRGWVGYLEGLAAAWLAGDEVAVDRLVELATATLAASLTA